MVRDARARFTAVLAVALAAALLPAGAPPAGGRTRTTIKEHLLSLPTPVLAPELESALERAGPGDWLPVLVQVKDLEIRDADLARLQDLGFRNLVRLDILPVAYGIGTPSMIRALAAHPRTRRIELNVRIPWALDRSTVTVKAAEGVWDRYVKRGQYIGMPIDGTGVTIAILDSGVDATHPDLALGRKTVANYHFVGQSLVCFYEGDPCTVEDQHPEAHGTVVSGTGLWVPVANSDTTSFHGTHVAGIAAGNGAMSGEVGPALVGFPGDTTERRGVAPGASILGLGAGEVLFVLNALSGFDFIYHQLKDLGNPLNIRVINNSWGGAGEFDPNYFISQAVMVLAYDMDQYAPPGRHFNQHIVFAAGNDGPDADTTSLWARIPVTIGVANTTRNGFPPNDAGDPADAMNTSSSRGKPGNPWSFPDLAAPGTGIIAPSAHIHRGQPYIGLTGTSMSAPHVAGVLALMLQANPDLGLAGVPDDIGDGAPPVYQDPAVQEITEAEWILKATATHVAGSKNQLPGAPYIPGSVHSPDDGYGLVNAELAVAAALALRELRLQNPSATVSDALALAPSLLRDVDEVHPGSDTLSTAWWGSFFNWGVGASAGGAGASVTPFRDHHLTVPTNYTSLKLTLRWKQLADLDLRFEYWRTTDTASPGARVVITQQAPPVENGVKTVTITPGCTFCGSTFGQVVTGDVTKPWNIQVVTRDGAAVDVDWSVVAELKHTGEATFSNPPTTVIGRNQTLGGPNVPDVVRRWGDWHDASNGSTPLHEEPGPLPRHTIRMKYYDLGSATGLSWSRKGNAPPTGSSKFDPRAKLTFTSAEGPPDQNPVTRTIRLSYLAWTAWHQPAGGGPPQVPAGAILTLLPGSATSGQFTDQVTFKASLEYPPGRPLGGKTVTFSLGAQQVQATTNALGIAQASLVLLQSPADYTLTAAFAGDAEAPGGSTSASFTILPEDTALALTVRAKGPDAILSATLTDADSPGSQLPGRTIRFFQGGTAVGEAQTGSPAVLVVRDVDPAAGPFTASFEGDGSFLGSQAGPVPFVRPQAPAILSPGEGAQLNDPTPTISGSADPGVSVELAVDGVTVGTPVADPGGTWSYTLTPAQALADGPHTATAVAADSEGNESLPSPARAFAVDTVAPATPAILVPPEGAQLNDPTPTISGTAEPGVAVELSVDGVLVGTAVADPSGGWSYTLTAGQALADGGHAATARAVDAATNASPPSAPRAFAVDTVAPPAPTIEAPPALTTDPTPEIAGTAEPGTTVAVELDGGAAGTAVAGPGGAWSLTAPPLADGGHTAVATATDAAGNVSPPSAPRTFTVDATAPAPPVIEAPAAGAALNSTTVAVSGTAEAGSTVRVFEGASLLASTTAAPAWSVSVTLPEGPHTLTATATDPAGNQSPPSSRSFTVDVTPPPAPVVRSPAEGSLVGTNAVAVAGTSEAGSTVRVFEGQTLLGVAVAGAAGAWSVTVVLADGPHTLTATATDAAGNVSPPSSPRSFRVDADGPDAPSVVIEDGDGVITRSESFAVPLSGSRPADTALRVTVSDTVASTPDVILSLPPGSGPWRVVADLSPLGLGAVTARAVAIDELGRASPPATATSRIIPDEDLPVPPRVEILDTDGIVSPAQEDLQAVGVRVTHLGPAPTGTVELELTDGTTTRRLEPRTLARDVPEVIPVSFTGLADGEITVRATVLDADPRVTGTDTTVLDRTPPLTVWGSSSSVCLVVPVVGFSTCSLTGRTTDTATPIEYVYVSGRNTAGATYGRTATLDARGARDTTWRLSGSAFADLPHGSWTFTAQGADRAGNLEPPGANAVTVLVV